MTINNLEKTKDKVISILNKYLGDNYILFLFGSFAKNNIDRISDMDLAVYSINPISSTTMTKIKEELENKAGTLRNIDLINLFDGDVNDKLMENIINRGVIWKAPKNSKELLKNLRRHLKSLKK